MRREVMGFITYTDDEYEAALRDKEKIDIINKKYNLTKRKQLEEVYSSIINGQLRFETKLGFDFEDEIDYLFKNASDSKTIMNKKTAKAEAAETEAVSVKHIELEDFDKDMQDEIINQINIKNKRRNFVLLISALVAVCCLSYFAVYSYFSSKNENDSNELAQLKEKKVYTPTGKPKHNGLAHLDKTDTPDILEEYKLLYSKNQSIIGWINIADTNIDYPVMQCSDNEYYLTHDFSQEYDKNGCIFMDCNCTAYPKSDNLIIYGHHMSSGKMFGTLQKYDNYNYYLKHSVISFDTIYERGQYAIMYVFRDKISTQDDIGFKYYEFISCNSEKEFNSYMNEMAQASLYDTGITAQYGDSLITLSTCDYNQKNGRFVVVAKQID